MLLSSAPTHRQPESWLSLVAETAGVAGCGIARVAVTVPTTLAPRERLVVQVRDGRGAVLGAAEFGGDAGDASGLEANTTISLDVGYSSVDLEPPLSVVGWIETFDRSSDPEFLDAPAEAASAPLGARVSLVLCARGLSRYAA